MYGCGPYDSMEKILKSMVTTRQSHEAIKEDAQSCPLYFMNWQNIDLQKEFRIFVYNNEITAISTQNLFLPSVRYAINTWLKDLQVTEIEQIVYTILHYFDVHIRNNMSYMKHYVMDLALTQPDNKPYFIEANTFGKDYAAGSSLFQWAIDHDQLHDNTSIEFRFVERD